MTAVTPYTPAKVRRAPVGPCVPGKAHHWRLETPCGPITPGVCRNCGEERGFPAYAEWDVRAEKIAGFGR